MKTLKDIEIRAFKTYKARVQAAERLQLLANVWNLSLISLATATTVASVGLLSDSEMYGDAGSTLLTALAVLSLVVSLVVAAQGYSARSRNMFMSYRKFQRISSQAEFLQTQSERLQRKSATALMVDYNNALDESENHTNADYLRVFPAAGSHWRISWSRVVLVLPLLTLVVPLLVLVPFVLWALRASGV